jgi:NAD(P)-dependent dehydrogenase (short-subunit alcohol dehydrogenase family)
VTGGSGGIGRAVARELAREGVAVAIAARDADRLRTVASELTDQTGATVVGIPVDTGDDESVLRMVAVANDRLGGGIDILVNGAAMTGGEAPAPKLAALTGDLFWADVDVKVMGYLRCAREVAPHMVEQGWGRIISIGGLAARQSGSIIGSIRNVAVGALTKNLADELGPSGITVTAVHPSITLIESVSRRIAEQATARHIPTDEVMAELGARSSSSRLVDPVEVAWVITFLASPRSIAINGDAVDVSGGIRGVIHY